MKVEDTGGGAPGQGDGGVVVDGGVDVGATPPPASWRESLPAEIRTSKTWDKFKGNSWDEVGPALAAQFVNVEKAVGAKTEGMVRVPGKDAKPEEVAAFRKAIGVPETVEGYADVRAPEGATLDDKTFGMAKERLHRAGYTTAQVQEAVNLYHELHTTGRQRMVEGWLKEQEQLDLEWGADYENRHSLAMDAFKKYGSPELAALFEATGLDVNPKMIRMFYNIGTRLREGGHIDGQVEGRMSKEQVAAKLSSLRNDPKYQTDKAMQLEALRLQEILTPGLADLSSSGLTA